MSEQKKLLFLLLVCGLMIFSLYLASFFIEESDKVSYDISDNIASDGDELFSLGMGLVNILSSFGHTGFSSSDIIGLDDSSSLISDRIFLYSSLVDRLILEDDIVELEISPFSLYLYFLYDRVSTGDKTVSSLLERPFRRRLNRHLRKKKKSRKKGYRNIYASFLTRDSILRGRKFLRENYVILRKMERKYNIPKEFLVSILFIETQLGEVTGDHYVLNVYNSLYHYDHNNLLGGKRLVVRDIVSDVAVDGEELVKANDISFLDSVIYSMNNFIFPSLGKFNSSYSSSLALDFSMERVEEGTKYVSSEVYYDLVSYVKRKKEWGYNQLKSLIIMSFSRGIDIHNLKGSWAGAFGFCQFIPSSYLSLARDGNDDGVIDLFLFADAFASAAHYLKESGFSRGNRKKIRSSIYRYNFSTDYVNTVYNYAIFLKSRRRSYRGRRYKRFRSRRRSSLVKQ